LLTLQSLGRIVKPEYLFRPQQIARRLWIEASGKKSTTTTVRLPWGYPLAVNPGEQLGWAVYSRAIFETSLTEALWRLVSPGDTVVDGGANIGYATSILAARVGPIGKVHSFEPNPRAFGELAKNVEAWKKRGQRDSFVLHEEALGARPGTATLHVPDSFEWNGGRASIESESAPIAEAGSRIEVKVVSLDQVFPKAENLSVVKLDLEGFELEALKGMESILRERRVGHIVFEEMDDYPAPTHEFLQKVGYSVFGLDYRLRGIKCCPNQQPRTHPVHGPPPNYVATYQPKKTVRLLERGLWRSFGPASYLPY
jgi:FkbM family methyltransferase